MMRPHAHHFVYFAAPQWGPGLAWGGPALRQFAEVQKHG
jgi:hypothetical protein